MAALLACLAALLAPASALRLAPRAFAARGARRGPVMASASERGEAPLVRVSVVGNNQLIARATATTKKQVESVSKADGININIAGVQIWPKPRASVVGLFVVFLMMLRKAIMKGGIRRAFFQDADSRYLANTKAEQAELHEFQCEKCGFTIFPARGREGKFFPDGYACMQCGAPKEAFFDMNDPVDPRAIEARANDPDFTYETEEIEVVVADAGEGATPGTRPSPPKPSPPAAGAPATPLAPPPAPPLATQGPVPLSAAAAPPPSPAPPPPAPPKPKPKPQPDDTDDFDPLNNPLLR